MKDKGILSHVQLLWIKKLERDNPSEILISIVYNSKFVFDL